MSAIIRVYATAKNRAVFGVAAAFLRLYPNAILADLNSVFVKDEITSLSYVNTIFIDIKDADKVVNSIGQNRFASYFMTDEFLTLSDGVQISVLKTWSVKDFERLVEKAAQYGIEIGGFESAAAFEKGSFRLEILQDFTPQEFQRQINFFDLPQNDEDFSDQENVLDEHLLELQKASLKAIFDDAKAALDEESSKQTQDIFSVIVSKKGKIQNQVSQAAQPFAPRNFVPSKVPNQSKNVAQNVAQRLAQLDEMTNVTPKQPNPADFTPKPLNNIDNWQASFSPPPLPQNAANHAPQPLQPTATKGKKNAYDHAPQHQLFVNDSKDRLAGFAWAVGLVILVTIFAYFNLKG